MAGGEEQEIVMRPSWGRRVVEQAYRRILNASGYKTEDCSRCRSNYYQLQSEHTQIDIDNICTIAEPSDEERARCHGCELAEIIRLFWMEILREKGLGAERFLPWRCTIDGNYMRSFILSDLNSSGQEKMNLIKVTKPTEMEPWGHWLLSTLESRLGIPRPPYVECATEVYPISGDTGSAAAVDKSFSWFLACSSDHQSCGSSENVPVLPTRVLEISDRDNIRIIESNGRRGHYVSLSHRWLDDKKMIRLLKGNIEEFKQQIPWEKLTQTFRDAIIFTGEFSARYMKEYPDRDPIRYIWIDSLCIIQNCKEDWRREANLMHAVYREAIITIAGATGTDGCFSKSHRHYRGFNIVNEQRPNPVIHLRKELPRHREASAFDEPVPVDLYTRGWVLQERLLSRRFLVFAPDELRWECFERTDCECKATNDGIQHAIPNDLRSKFSLSKVQREDPNNTLFPKAIKISYYTSFTDNGEHRERNLKNWWRRLVQIYSELKLTNEGDRLPAIQGLSTHYGGFTGMDQKLYVAGHWIPCMPYDLAWYTSVPADNNTKRAGPIPSWSWASCARPVKMPTEDDYSEHRPHLQFSLSPTLISGCQPLLLKCKIFTGTTKNIQGLSCSYKGNYLPDFATFAEIDNEVCQHILIFSSKMETSSPQWYFIRVEAIEGEEVTYRRKGSFILEQGPTNPPESYDGYETLMYSYFRNVSEEEIILF